jgi:hypothetical protein
MALERHDDPALRAEAVALIDTGRVPPLHALDLMRAAASRERKRDAAGWRQRMQATAQALADSLRSMPSLQAAFIRKHRESPDLRSPPQGVPAPAPTRRPQGTARKRPLRTVRSHELHMDEHPDPRQDDANERRFALSVWPQTPERPPGRPRSARPARPRRSASTARSTLVLFLTELSRSPTWHPRGLR